MTILMPSQEAALQSTADALGVNRDWLFMLIDFESGWRPAARNAVTGARGLIQFMPKTAQGLGYQAGTAGTAADTLVAAFPTIEGQLAGPVLKYLKQYAPFTSDYDLFMSVFYPGARAQSPATRVPDSVSRANPGINFWQDYVDLVYKHAGIQRAIGGGAVLAVLMLIAAGVYLHKKGGLRWPGKRRSQR